MNDLLFVYGTLMSGLNFAAGEQLAREGLLLGAATTQGRLFDLGAYPGFVMSDNTGDIVHGEVYRLHDPAQSLEWLDAYEGIDPGGTDSEYTRRRHAVRVLKPEQDLKAWIYVYNGLLRPGQRIFNGRWGEGLKRAKPEI